MTPPRAGSTSPGARRRPRAEGVELYHGTLSTFLAGGFEEVGRTGPRPVVRLALR